MMIRKCYLSAAFLVLLNSLAVRADSPKESDGVGAVPRSRILEGAKEIDRLVEEGWKKHKVKPNPKANDQIFMRRAYLDVTGTIPTGQQALNFINSKRSDRREVLVDHLLSTDGYASHFFNYWADVLRVKSGIDNLELHGYIHWLKDSLHQNKRYDRMVRELLTATGKPGDNGAVGYYMRDQGMPLDNLSSSMAVFLGTQVGCAQCHDHPFERWTQKDFYQLAAFTYGVDTHMAGPDIAQKRKAMEAEMKKVGVSDKAAQEIRAYFRYNTWELGDNPKKALKFPKDYQYDNAKGGEVAVAKVIFGPEAKRISSETPREAFARWVTAPENPLFARVIANRLWKKVMGVGLIEPIDALEGAEASNPALLDFLAKEMVRLKFDMKQFLRMLLNTDLYSRQAVFRDTIEETFYFPGPVLRRMSAEQIWDSLVTLSLDEPTSSKYDELNPYRFPYFDIRKTPAEQIVANGVKLVETRAEKAKTMKTMPRVYRASELRQPSAAGHLLRDFGQSDRELHDGGNTDPSVAQILTMLNGKHHAQIMRDETVLSVHLKQVENNTTLRTRVIYLSILGREPTAAEEKLALQLFHTEKTAKKGNSDLIWVLLNIPEFMFIQ